MAPADTNGAQCQLRRRYTLLAVECVRVLTGNVRTTCPTCGTVDIQAGDVTILPCIAATENVYRFCCPRCQTWIVRNANPSIVTVLLRAGAYSAPWDERVVVNEPSRASITDDEVREFREQLERLPTAER